MNKPLPLLNGPSALPTQTPKYALICLHGFGANGHDLLPLAAPLQAACGQLGESLALFFPHAPAPTPIGQGRQWFSDANWTFRDRPGIEIAKNQLWAYLTHLSQHHNIPLSNMALLGFSQGAMLGLYAMPRFPQPIAALISHSGCAMYQEDLNPTTCQKAPVLFLHGQDDDVVTADQSIKASQGLQNLGYPTELHLIPNLGHGFNMQTIAHIGVFLQQTFNPPSSH